MHQIIVILWRGSWQTTPSALPLIALVSLAGLTCTPSAPFENFTASFTVIRCTDPIQVNFTITLSSGGAIFTSVFDCSQAVQFGGDTSVNVGTSRNATHLDFQALMNAA